MQRVRLSQLVLVLTLVPLLGAMAQPSGGPPPALVGVAPVVSEELSPRRVVTGVIRARRVALLASRAEGLVSGFDIERGAHLSAGDVIARLDPELADLLVRERTAQVAAAEATIERREAELDDAEDDLERTRTLAQRGSTSETEIADAQIAVRVSKAELAEAAAQLEAQRARLAEAERMRKDLDVRAPFDAVVIDVHTELGQWIERGGDVVTVIEADRLEVVLDLPEHLVHAGRTAGTIEAEVTGLGVSVDGTPLAVVPQSDARAGLIPLRVEVPAATSSGIELVPGMRVTARLPEGDPVTTLVVPKDAIGRGPLGEFVFVVTPRGPDAPPVATMTTVRVLFAFGDRAAISAPRLEAGAQVVVDGNERLNPGQPLNIKPQTTAGASDAG